MDTIDKAFEAINRVDFVPINLRNKAFLDIPLPIGYGQTISQPTTVKLMLRLLTPSSGDKILDVGSGSGWTTALLSYLVGNKGQIFAVEIIPELLKFGKDNYKKINFNNAKFFLGNRNIRGLPEHGPYDRILVSASATILPKDLIDQLKVGGKMVIPVKNDILEIYKQTNEKFKTILHPGFIFVPLI